MNEVRYNEIGPEEAGQRLDNYLLRILKGVPKSHIYRIIRGGEVRINKKRAQPSSRLMQGDRIRIPPIRTSQEKPIYVGDRLGQLLNDSIIFEDNRLLVINKPAGIAVHGGSGLSLGIIEALRKLRSDLAYLELVHRLDKETSGCLVLAKKRSFLRAIQALFESREIDKTYWAILLHHWEGEELRYVDVKLEKNILKSGERMVFVTESGKASRTRFRLLENYQRACWVEASPETGRTHQIRVHSAFLGHPVAGDIKYGQAELSREIIADKPGLYLHARAIQFILNGEKHYYEAKPYDNFSEALKRLRTIQDNCNE